MDSAQKGVLDFPARVLHPIPENVLTRLVTATPITPNHITVFTALIAFMATYLFTREMFAWGLAIAVVVNVLDGVDGKLARVTLVTSRLGDRLDHILDVAFEFSWYVGIGWGLQAGGDGNLPLLIAVGLVVMMASSRAASGAYKLTTGRQIHDHRRFDRGFRLVAGRRNIYTLLFVIGLALGHLDRALVVAFGWSVLTVFVYVIRVGVEMAGRGHPT
jgi:phosphatidylglycerophosphate synthase